MVSIGLKSEAPDPSIREIVEIMESQGIPPSKHRAYDCLSQLTMLKSQITVMAKIDAQTAQLIGKREGELTSAIAAEGWHRELMMIESLLPHEIKQSAGEPRARVDFPNGRAIKNYVVSRIEELVLF